MAHQRGHAGSDGDCGSNRATGGAARALPRLRDVIDNYLQALRDDDDDEVLVVISPDPDGQLSYLILCVYVRENYCGKSVTLAGTYATSTGPHGNASRLDLLDRFTMEDAARALWLDCDTALGLVTSVCHHLMYLQPRDVEERTVAYYYPGHVSYNPSVNERPVYTLGTKCPWNTAMLLREALGVHANPVLDGLISCADSVAMISSKYVVNWRDWQQMLMRDTGTLAYRLRRKINYGGGGGGDDEERLAKQNAELGPACGTIDVEGALAVLEYHKWGAEKGLHSQSHTTWVSQVLALESAECKKVMIDATGAGSNTPPDRAHLYEHLRQSIQRNAERNTGHIDSQSVVQFSVGKGLNTCTPAYFLSDSLRTLWDLWCHGDHIVARLGLSLSLWPARETRSIYASRFTYSRAQIEAWLVRNAQSFKQWLRARRAVSYAITSDKCISVTEDRKGQFEPLFGYDRSPPPV